MPMPQPPPSQLEVRPPQSGHALWGLGSSLGSPGFFPVTARWLLSPHRGLRVALGEGLSLGQHRVHSGCRPWTAWPMSVVAVSWVRSLGSEIEVPADPVPGEGPSWLADGHLCVSSAEETRKQRKQLCPCRGTPADRLPEARLPRLMWGLGSHTSRGRRWAHGVGVQLCELLDRPPR